MVFDFVRAMTMARQFGTCPIRIRAVWSMGCF
jgi:hypothetical protein